MSCFLPLFHSVRRYVRSLFRRSVRPGDSEGDDEDVASPTPRLSSTAATELPTGEPKDPESYSTGSPDSSSLVCAFCWDTGLFAPGPFREAWAALVSATGYSYTTTWSQLRLSANGSRCRWCALLLATRTSGPVPPRETLRVTVGFRPSSGNSMETPRGVQTLRIVLDDTPHSVYYVSTGADDVAAPLIVARTRVLQVDGLATRVLAFNCITDCIRKHVRCPPPHSASLPTRVIDCSDPSKPRLKLTEGEEASYLALSYVRGEVEFRGTTTENLRTFLNNIDLSLLPQTIQDAIQTTHAYGVRYLWVDVLCILQNSADDKVREVARLGATFQNAYFIIVAAGAPDASSGFLYTRAPPSGPDATVLPFRCPDGQVGTMTLSPAWRQYDGAAEPTNDRAWCFVERLLAPRALVFASHTLQFQCRTETVNVGNAVCGPLHAHRLPDILFRPEFESRAVALSPEDTNTLRWSWIETVGEYTERVLSDPADKLVAFSALAALFHRAWRSEYLAGLWRDTLLQDVLWYKTPESGTCAPPSLGAASSRAPSWSWAAVDGRVMAATTDERLDPAHADTHSCEVVRCEAVPATPALPFGPVASATLVLRAVMVKAAWNPTASMPDVYISHDDDPRMGTLRQPSSSTHARDTSVSVGSDRICVGCAYPDSGVPESESGSEDLVMEEDVWVVPVRWNERTQYAAGLIVARVEGRGEESRFRRVGYFHSPEDLLGGGLDWITQGERQEIVLV